MGGVIRSFRRGGTPIFREGPPEITDANDGGSYPLVPFSNRVRDGRFSFRGRGFWTALVGAPLVVPWLVIGVSGLVSDRADLLAAVMRGRGHWPRVN